MSGVLKLIAYAVAIAMAGSLVESVTGWDTDFPEGFFSAIAWARFVGVDWRKPSQDAR
jgi:hypothetical protein